jgi:hypothetical protein
VGAAGGQFNSSPQTLEATLKQLSAELGTTTIEFYPDAGAIHNPHVLRQYRSTWRRLQQLGYSVEIQWWGQILKEAPDADELTDYNTIESITIEQFNTLAQQSDHLLTRLLKLLDRGKGQRKPPARQPAIQPMLPPASTAHIQEYQPGERLRLYQQAIEQGYRFILDSSWTGTGKSFDAGQMAVIDFRSSSSSMLPTSIAIRRLRPWTSAMAGLTWKRDMGAGRNSDRQRRGALAAIATG